MIAVLFGAVSGCAPAWLDALLMRLTEIFLSVPNLLLVIFLLAAAGKSNVITISAKVLEGLELGNYKITILTTDGNQPTVLVSVIDSNADTADPEQ